MALLASVANLATSWCNLHQLKIGPPRETTCICSKFGHQVVPLALVPKLAIRCYKFGHQVASHCLGSPYWHYQLSVSMELVSSSAKVTSVEFWKGIVCTDTRTHRSDPRYMMKSYHGRYMLANKSLMGLRVKMQTNLQTQRSLSIFFDIVHHVTMFGWPKVGTNIFDFLVRYIFSSIQGLSELLVNLWHTVRMGAEVFPEASPKIWRFTDWKENMFFFLPS